MARLTATLVLLAISVSGCALSATGTEPSPSVAAVTARSVPPTSPPGGTGSATSTRQGAASPSPHASTPKAVADAMTGNLVGPTPPSSLPAVAGKVIALDPGHNGGNASDPSYINKLVWIGNGYKACDTTGTETDAGYTEATFNLAVALDTERILTAAGAHVVMTRTTNTGVGPCINVRAAIGNDAHAAVAISIHADGGPPNGYGFQVLTPIAIPGYNTAIITPSWRLGLDVRKYYQAATGEPFSTYAGTAAMEPRNDLGGLNLSKVPKVFLETGNMRNASDAAKLISPAFQQRIALGIAEALNAFLAGH